MCPFALPSPSGFESSLTLAATMHLAYSAKHTGLTFGLKMKHLRAECASGICLVMEIFSPLLFWLRCQNAHTVLRRLIGKKRLSCCLLVPCSGSPTCLVFMWHRTSIAEIPLFVGRIGPPLRMLSKWETVRKWGGCIAPNWPF